MQLEADVAERQLAGDDRVVVDRDRKQPRPPRELLIGRCRVGPAADGLVEGEDDAVADRSAGCDVIADDRVAGDGDFPEETARRRR